MTTLDESLHWTEHFARYGFAVCRGLVDREFCDEALADIRRKIDNDLPLQEWSTENTPVLHRPFFEGGTPPEPTLDRIFEQPRLRAAIEELYGGPGHWNEAKNYYIFLRPYDPKSEAKFSPRGHIDFGNQPVPALYRGFTFQVALADTEPFSGNLTIYPGTHITVQKQIIENPEQQYKSGTVELDAPEPFEFVAKAGDVLFMHHIVMHAGNPGHAANRSPRIALHCEAFRDEWLHSIDPSQPNLSAWQRSLAHNGAYEEAGEVVEYQMTKRNEYLEKLREENMLRR
jgi:ectoine hydroxylase-related dioxygenase (phytanoyl-CoA dioxygenase family)